jgi:hypothetical protein
LSHKRLERSKREWDNEVKQGELEDDDVLE